jgi:hypothetical protein
MKFTLTFDGDLPSAGGSKRLSEKWEIRRFLQPQLAELWETSPILSRLAKFSKLPNAGGISIFEQHHSCPDYPAPDPSFTYIDVCEPLYVEGHSFLPLIRDSLALVCGLDILFLRKEEPGKLVEHGGDIDNRIKTLFDGLRMPTRDEMHLASPHDPQPFFLLPPARRFVNFRCSNPN